MYYQYKDLQHPVRSKTSVENQKAEMLWALTEAKRKRVDLNDAGHKKEIKTCPSVAGPLGNPCERPDGRIGIKVLENLEQRAVYHL